MSHWNGSLSEVSFPNQSINQYSSAIPGYFLCLGECFVNLFSGWITEKKPFSSISLSYFVIVCELLRHQKNYIITPSQYVYSPYCSQLASWSTDEKDLPNNQEFLQLIIISITLMTLVFDSVVQVKGKLTTVDAGHSLVVMG